MITLQEIHDDVLSAAFIFIKSLSKTNMEWSGHDKHTVLKANINMPQEISVLFAKSIIETNPKNLSLEELSDLVCVFIFARGIKDLLKEYARL